MELLLKKAKRLRGVELFDYQVGHVERFIKHLENGGTVYTLSHNSILFIEREYANRFRN